MDSNNNNREDNVNVDSTKVERKEQPSMVGATFIKYAAYVVILVIVLVFLAKFILPMI